MYKIHEKFLHELAHEFTHEFIHEKRICAQIYVFKERKKALVSIL